MNPKRLDKSVVQISFYLSDKIAIKEPVLEWCNTRLGVKAPYPHGRWTYFPFYMIDGKYCIRVVLYYPEDHVAFALVWGKDILEQKID